MKFNGKIRKKIPVLLAAGGLAIASPHLPKLQIPGQNVNVQNNEQNQGYKKNQEKEKPQRNFDEKELKNAKSELKKQIKDKNVKIDKQLGEYVTGVLVDGRKVSIELVDGKTLSGELDKLQLDDITLEKLYIYDSKYLKDEMKMSPEELSAKYENHKKIEADLKKVKVIGEFKISEKFDSECDYAFTFNNYLVDISNCKKVWLDSMVFSEKDIEEINKCNVLEDLIITNSFCSNDLNEFYLDIPSLKTLSAMFDMSSKPLRNFDLNKCENLENLSIGNGFQTTSLKGIGNCENIKQLGFGSLPGDKTDSLDIVKNDFNEINLLNVYDTSNEANTSAYARENFISDITAIKGSQIEILNISFLRYVTSEQLLDVVRSLPNLKTIVGTEISNAPMCSEELISYCKEHKIEQPFTEKSLEIKNKIRNIVNSIIKPEMTDQEKIKFLTRFILENVEYDHEISEKETKDLTDKEIKNYWGESLEYSLNNGKAICEGYAREATALFLEAKLNVFDIPLKVGEEGHVINIVEVDGEYYEIDLTNLDWFIRESGVSYEDYEYSINSIYYMIPVNESKSGYIIIEPEESENQRRQINETNNNIEENVMAKSVDNKSERETNKKGDLHKLMGLLMALGIAGHITKQQLELYIKESDRVSQKNEHIWSLENLKNLEVDIRDTIPDYFTDESR